MSLEIPLERCTDTFQQIISYAVEEASQRGEDSPDTLNILRAMLRLEGEIAEVALRNNEVGNEAIPLNHESAKSTDITMRELYERCTEEAQSLQHFFPGTEHLLLAICCTPSCRGAKLLRNLDGRDLREAICHSILSILGNSWEDWREQHTGAFL